MCLIIYYIFFVPFLVWFLNVYYCYKNKIKFYKT